MKPRLAHSKHARRRVPRRFGPATLFGALLLILCVAALAAPARAAPPTPLPPEATVDEANALEDVEQAYRPAYLDLATGNPRAVSERRLRESIQSGDAPAVAHATYAWPFNVSFTLGHAIQSYQNYSSGTSSAYFHHGLDIMAPNGTDVFTRSGGQVVNVENYQPGNDLYWEVAIKDPEGYIWQYHHIDKNTIPQAIKDKFAQYKADPVNGGFVAANTYIGDIVYWTVTSFGKRFNHIHLNILAAGGVYMDGFEFLAPLADTAAPQIQAVGLLQNNAVKTGTTISGDYGLYVRARDLVLDTVYWLPPYKVDFSIDGGPVTTVWEFVTLPGGASNSAYVNDYYVAPPTCGNYSCREFYVDLGFTTGGQRTFPGTNGYHTVSVTAYDYAGNSASSAFTWTVTGGISNPPPIADPQDVSTLEDTPVSVTLSGSDSDGAPLTYSVTAAPQHGTLSGVAPDLVYTPAADFNGADSFAFVTNDGQANSTPATVSITVAGVNDAPVAVAQSVATEPDMAVAITLTGTDADGDSLTFAVTGGPTLGSLSGTAPDLIYTPAPGALGSDSFTFVASDGTIESTPAEVSITIIPPVTGPLLYLGSAGSGTAGGVSFADEDILLRNAGTGAWSLFIDGSDIGLSGTDVDAFEWLPDGSALMSFDTAFTLSGFGAVDDSDILRFTPTSTGATTAGTWAWYFDGSDVGLSANDEDVDAFALLPDGRLVISTLGNVSVTGASAADEDLLVFTATALGATTSGSWAIYFDGSDVALTATSEDVNGAWVDTAGKIYLTTVGAFGVSGLSGDGSDIFVCTPTSTGSTTACTWALFWDGSAQGFANQDTDSLSIAP